MNILKPRGRSRRNSINYIAGSDKWKSFSRSVSRRENNYMDDDSEDEDIKLNNTDNWDEEFFGRNSLNATKSDQDIEVQLTKKQTLILSTLLPDEILLMEKFETADSRRFVGVLLMADVSGYTSLSERYHNTGKGGTYRLTVTLNTYLGALIELIYSYGGDVIKFAGDAFLALWKTDKRTFLCHTIHTVIACALVIQHSYGSYETDVKVNLKVKLAISAGNLIFAPIGTGIDMNYVIFGLPVLEAKVAESLCKSGEVKLTPTAWGHCYSRNYDHVIDDNNGHVTIKAILYDPREKNVSKPFQGLGSMMKHKAKYALSAIENLPTAFWESEILCPADTIRKNEIVSLRTTILQAEERNIGSEIRKFMIRPVLTQIDAHQPLEYLTEMRQVSILFITLKPRECPFLQLITIVNNAYQITCDIVYKSMGCVNKIILFDKDVMILVVFGLRGFKHESEAQAALKCSYSIKKSVSALDGVLEVSIGVTTGQVYCGVVGHPLRREFTVIGAIVNKAARLMCSFRNKITCDESTYVKSKMSKNGFTLQPQTELKGIISPGKIYEYTEDIRVKELGNIPMIPPLLNRSDEVDYFGHWLDDSHKSYRDFDGLLLVGESRIGKSRLLEWMAREAGNTGYNVSCLTLTSIHSATPYLALSQIMNRILGISDLLQGFEKEEKIVQLLHIYHEDLCYLNNIMKVRFAYHEGMYYLDDNQRTLKAKSIFRKLIMAIENVHVIFLDDLQNLDPSSWEYLLVMMESLKIFIVCSVTRGKFNSIHSWLYNVFINGNIRKICLGPLASTWTAPLACQILDVDAVPNDLCNALKSKCKGMPGLVESFIVHLFSSGALELIKVGDGELDSWKSEELQFPDQALLHPQALSGKEQENLDQLIQNDTNNDISICIVTNKAELKTNINVQNLDAIIMIQIDSLTPYQQLLLKIASVIGNVLSRVLLENIMYENDHIKTAKAVKRLFAMRILHCANAKRKFSNRSTASVGSQPLSCECTFEYDPDENENLPKYAFCQMMRFKSKTSRKTCYELLPINQKKEFHTRIVNFLENNQQKCPSCGGVIMVVQSMIEIYAPGVSEDFLYNPSVNSDESSSLNSTELEVNGHNISGKSSLHSVSDTAQSSSMPVHFGHNVSSILKSKTEDKSRKSNRVTMQSIFYKKGMDQSSTNVAAEEQRSTNIFGMFRAVTEAESLSDWQALGVCDSDDGNNVNVERSEKHIKPFKITLEQGISAINFNKCTCRDLKVIIYEQLIHHATQAELKFKTVEFLIKYSHLNMTDSSFSDCIPKLDEAEQYCLDTKLKDLFTKFERRRFLAKIYTLRAAAYLMDEKLSLAKMDIDRATKLYKLNLGKVSDFFKLRSIFTAAKIKRCQYRINKAILNADSVLCLNIATMLYSALGDDSTARNATLQAVELVQKSECELVDMCEALSNAIQVELDRATPEFTLDVERMAIQALRRLSNPVKGDELFALGKLFMSIFRARIARAKLVIAIRAGFRSMVISRFLQADMVSLEIIPDLFYLLLARRRLSEAVDLLQETLRMGQRRSGLECEIWYYALCMDMILDAGFQLESPHDINRFAEVAVGRESEGRGMRRLVVGLWTYWLRCNMERRAKKYETDALNWAGQADDDGSLSTLLCGLRLAEGMLECLARKVDDLRKVVDMMELRSLADRELNRLEKDARVCRTVYARWLLLRANSYKMSGRHPSANSGFAQALEESRKTKNRLEEALVKAASITSSVWVESALVGRFPGWREGGEMARMSWHQLMYRITSTR